MQHHRMGALVPLVTVLGAGWAVLPRAQSTVGHLRGVVADVHEVKGDDPHGHRAEFIRLIGAADGITRLQSTAPPGNR